MQPRQVTGRNLYHKIATPLASFISISYANANFRTRPEPNCQTGWIRLDPAESAANRLELPKTGFTGRRRVSCLIIARLMAEVLIASRFPRELEMRVKLSIVGFGMRFLV